MTARSIRARSPRTAGRPQRALERDVAGAAARALDAGLHDRGEVEHLEVALRRPLAGELDEIADEAGQLAQLREHVLAQLAALFRRQLARAREQLDVGLHGGQRGAQLVRGVGDQLALGAARLGQRLEHRVEAARQRGQLVVADRLDAARQVVRGRHVARAAHQPAHRAHRAAADEAAEQRRQHHARQAHQREHRRQPPHRGVDGLERARGLQRLAVGEAPDVHAHVGARQLGVVEERLRLPLGDGDHARAGRQQRLLVRRRLDPPRARHDLGVAGLLAERRRRQQEQEPPPLLLRIDLAPRRALLRLRRGRHAGAESAQGVVDRVAQLGASRDIGGDRGQCDGGRDGERGEQHQAAPVAHDPSMKPTPRTVWISRGSPPSSVLRRR